MLSQFCPECGGEMLYDSPVRRYVCKSCGLYVTKDEIREIREKGRVVEDERRRKRREYGEYLEWWLGKKRR